MAREGFGTDPTGRLAAGPPRAESRGPIGIGVGNNTMVGPAWKSGPAITLKKTFKKGGSVSSASKRADGCATKGKTRGKFV